MKHPTPWREHRDEHPAATHPWLVVDAEGNVVCRAVSEEAQRVIIEQANGIADMLTIMSLRAEVDS